MESNTKENKILPRGQATINIIFSMNIVKRIQHYTRNQFISLGIARCRRFFTMISRNYLRGETYENKVKIIVSQCVIR